MQEPEKKEAAQGGQAMDELWRGQHKTITLKGWPTQWLSCMLCQSDDKPSLK